MSLVERMSKPGGPCADRACEHLGISDICCSTVDVPVPLHTSVSAEDVKAHKRQRGRFTSGVAKEGNPTSSAHSTMLPVF